MAPGAADLGQVHAETRLGQDRRRRWSDNAYPSGRARRARKAGDEEADLWLHALTRGGLSDGASAETIADWVKALRRRLKVKPPIEEVRAKTRARVRRHRDGAKGKRISPEAAL